MFRILDFLIAHLMSNNFNIRRYFIGLIMPPRYETRYCNRKIGMTPLTSLSDRIYEKKGCHATTDITTYSTRCNPN